MGNARPCIDVWNAESFDSALLGHLEASERLILDYLETKRRNWIEREASDRTRPYPENRYWRAWNIFTDLIGLEMQSRTIRAWHHCRLTDEEVEAFCATGPRPSDLEGLRARLSAQVAQCRFDEPTAEALFAASPFQGDQHQSRSGKFWMTAHPRHPADSGVELLLSHWGGESTYFWLQDEALIDLVRTIGKARIIEVAVPLAETRHSHSAVGAVISAFARTIGAPAELGDFDLYATRPLGPRAVLAVHSEGERFFSQLTEEYPDKFRASVT